MLHADPNRLRDTQERRTVVARRLNVVEMADYGAHIGARAQHVELFQPQAPLAPVAPIRPEAVTPVTPPVEIVDRVITMASAKEERESAAQAQMLEKARQSVQDSTAQEPVYERAA